MQTLPLSALVGICVVVLIVWSVTRDRTRW